MNDPDLQNMSNEQLIKLAGLAIKFQQQQVGRRPGEFHRYIASIVKTMPKPTFENLLYQLELAAVVRNQEGEKASPIEKVNRIWELITWHHPRKGRIQTSFGTIRNHLTKAKKNKFTVTAKS